ncbi:restriction endonuclease subunit S [Vibrio cincinnatiensis]|uniref:restriction endonuclease subunit S n=1 Tax=Vibrio cincinnatiensis TaxID=675 RepID=UPI001EE09701|nr:restriction endonuclease subunit S [Vibrio cincinnatiensis]MCG3723533.1 restriction endonuclease subunit S [Vibrio cincinnatiensis]
MTADKNVPEIRFKGFSGEWGKSPLGSLCLIGDIDHRMPESKITGIPYLMTGDFYGINGLDFSNAKLISIEDYEQLSKKIKPEFGDILFARYASVGAVRYVETDIKFLISYSCAILKTNNTTYGKYLFYFFQTEKTQGQFELSINTGSQRNIGIDSLKSLLVALPKPDEQTQIGNYFQKLDRLINQHQQKHDKLSNIKKAMLEKMFPKKGETVPETRFKGFSGEWEDIGLLESIERVIDFRGRTPKKLGLDWSPSGYRALSALNVKQGYIDFSIDPHFGDQELYDKWMSGSELHQGQVLFTTEAPMGNVAQVPDADKYILSQRTIAFVVKPKVITDAFLAVLLRSSKVFQELSALSSGGTAKGVSQKALANLNVLIPSDLDEQTAIGNYFQKLDTLINQHQQQITKLTNIKQACLSKMFV